MELKNWLKGIVAAAALTTAAAHAGTVTDPSLTGVVTITDGGTNVWNLPGSYTAGTDGTFDYSGSVSNASLWSFAWGITVNPDPFIDASLTITNNTSITKHFDLLFTLPVGSSFSSGQMSGSLTSSFKDFNSDGTASLNNIDWNGLIDGANAMSLFGGSFSCGGPGCIFNIGTVSDGPLSSGPVNTSIGTHLVFDLSAGDQASFTSHFEVVPTVVPVPAAVWLFGSGLFGLGALARRRRST